VSEIGGTGSGYRATVDQERVAREARLRDPMGWLSLVGLHWLQPGRQRFGGSEANEIVLRAEGADVPPLAGTFEVTAARVLVHPEPGSTLEADGRPVVDALELADDESETPTVLELGSLRLVLIRRGTSRQGIRVRDTSSRTLRAFRGLDYFGTDPRWRLTGRLLRADPGATIPIPDVLGVVNPERTPGVVQFDVEGQTQRLDALEGPPGALWLVFADRTNGHETYGGGRFLVTGTVQQDDRVEVDFNLAYNPPCVFSPYATCPLPPRGNQLDLRIEAGEKVWTAPSRGSG
jgi:uncharacterized protein (DUF1684 family)